MSFLGQDGFHWGIGVVEDRFDPEKLNRVRVRWLGIHDEDKEKILTKDLPWAQVMQPVSGSSMAGVGDTGSSLVEGTWVVGFAKDVNTLQDWIVMGTLPGDNTTTALQGESNKKWAKYRGNLKEHTKAPITSGAGPTARAVPIEADLANKFVDYEKGFHDPTVDMRNVPYPPSDVTIGHSQKFCDYDAGPGEHYPELHENALAKPQSYYVNSPSPMCGITRPKAMMIPEDFPDDKYEKTQRVPNYKPAGRAPNDLDPCDDEKWLVLPVLQGYAPKFTRITHSDILHYLYRTTRRVTADMRQCEAWTHFGTFAWPDVCTYGNRQHFGVNLSTGYLEDKFWRADKEAGTAPGGTWAPTWPITRDTPTASLDSAGMTGIDPLDNRASWGQESGEETGYFLLDGEEYRVTHPRTRYIQKGKLAPSQRWEVKDLFEAGQYGTGIYNISNPNKAEARKDIKWGDVKNTDLVVLPEKDTNRLAEGGIPIKSIKDNIVTTKASLYGDSTKYFAQPKESRGKNTKPLILVGDVITISGVRGAEEYNGRIYRVLAISDNKTSFDITLGTEDGIPWSGPGSITYGDTESVYPTIVDAVDLLKEYTDEYSAYLGEGIVSINPPWVIRAKAETRERQINIGSPEMNTGINMRFWNQPTSRWATQYPYNHVYETESGHIREYDDTPGAERIHEYHRAGTYYEIDHQGTKVDYVKGDNYNVRIFDDYLYVKGKVAWTMDDAVWIRANDRMDISAKWKIQIHSGGDLDLSSKRNINMKALGDINMQYDGHMNILGTALDPESAKYHAGTRPCKELSFFNLKTGHIRNEAIEDIRIQANKDEISIKTLTDTIYLTSGLDIETFAFGDSYTETLGRIYELSVMGNNRTAMAGDVSNVSLGMGVYNYALGGIVSLEAMAGLININANAGPIKISALIGTIDLHSAGAIKLTSLASTVDVYARGDLDLRSAAGNVNIMGFSSIKATTEVDNIHLAAKKNIKLLAKDEDIHIKANTEDVHISGKKNVHVHADLENIHIESDFASVNIMSYTDSYITTTAGDFNNRVLGTGKRIVETAPEIHMNGPTAEMATAATIAEVAIDASKAGMALPGIPLPVPPALPAFLAPTIDLIPINLPDPAPADGLGLGLNANDPGTPGSGYGGENIRVTHDTINDIITGNSNTKW